MPTVLVIDEELPVAMVIARVLRRDGIDTVGARNVADAIELLEEESVRLVVCDVKLGDGGARDVLDAMDRQRRSIPVVLLAGRPGGATECEIREHPLVADTLAKPFDIANLRAVVQKALGEAKKPR